MAHESKPGYGTQIIAGDQGDGCERLPAEALPIELPDGADRYQVERELARGSMGIIQLARDLTLQRPVAIKVLATESPVPNAAARFLDEARITAQLSHPAIAAVYEIGVNAEQVPFFAMQLIEGRSLRQILDGLVAHEPSTVRRFGRARLLSVFMRICMAVAYAHSRGVIHRDLKPGNIMLGNFDEVFVMDWGLAKILNTEVANPVVGGRPDDEVYRTRVGDITGTPTYMSPEQAMGLVDALSERTDIYGLGAILYELLTLRPPFSGPPQEILRQVRASNITPPAVRTPQAEVPPELDALVMRCMARDPIDRPPSAAELKEEVEACLIGAHTRLHRVRSAAPGLRDGARAGQVFRELARRRRRAAREVAELAALRLPYDSADELQALWARQAELADLQRELSVAFDRAVALYQQVLDEVPDHREAQEGLRDLFWYRFLEAERRDARAAMSLYLSLARQHDRAGALQSAIQGDGSLSVEAGVEGATATICRFEEGGLRLIGRPLHTLELPASLDPLPMGSYLVEVTAPGLEPSQVPVQITRQEAVELRVELLAERPEGTRLVPGGAYWSGAHEAELECPPRLRRQLPGFLIGYAPVTVGDYTSFLNALIEAGEASRARRHAPAGEGCRLGSDDRYHPAQYDGNPITGISALDATAYCAWRSQRDALRWRLPTAAEYEKAGRGVDGRPYPWGPRWDATLCRCRDSAEGGAPSAVGNETDESPYGVRDLAGGVREWTATEHPRDSRQRAIKGGGFDSPRAECHLAVRRFRKLDRAAPDLGFRLAMDLAPGPAR